MIHSLTDKLVGTANRLRSGVYNLPVRLRRLILHLSTGFTGLFKRAENQQRPVNRFLWWWIEFVFFLLDCLLIPEVYDSLMDFTKWKTRHLTASEKELSRKIFGNSIDLDRVRIDESAAVACKRYGICYVSFYTINSWGRFNTVLLIHELVHVWQFERLGSVYIPRALMAQRLNPSYNYKGIEKLKSVKAKNGSLEDFNLEQQADLVADYYCLKNGLMPKWCDGKPEYIPVFEYFIEKLKQTDSG